MTRVHLDAVAELDEPAERVEEALGALARLDREVGSSGVSDEERVARQDDPGLGSAREVAHGEAAVLGPVARRVDAAQDDLAEDDLVAVLQRIVPVLGCGGRVDADRDVVLEREAPVPCEMVGVRVRLDDSDDANAAPLGLLEVLLDRVGRVDDDGLRRFPDRRSDRTHTRGRRRRTG